MRIEKRKTHNLLYIATDGQQAIRIPVNVNVSQCKAIAAKFKPGTPNRRKNIIEALNGNGIRAT